MGIKTLNTTTTTKIDGRQNTDLYWQMGLLKEGSSQYYSYKLQRNDSIQQLLSPFTPDQLRENYCQNKSKFKINTSQSKKIPI